MTPSQHLIRALSVFAVGALLGGGAGCIRECNNDSNCPDGQVCSSNQCVAGGASSSSSTGGVSSSAAASSSQGASSSSRANSSSAVVNSSSVVVNSSSTVTVSSSSQGGQSSSAGGMSSSGGGGLVLVEGHIGTVGDARLVGGSSGQYVLTEMGFEGLGTTCAASLCVTGGITP